MITFFLAPPALTETSTIQALAFERVGGFFFPIFFGSSHLNDVDGAERLFFTPYFRAQGFLPPTTLRLIHPSLRPSSGHL